MYTVLLTSQYITSLSMITETSWKITKFQNYKVFLNLIFNLFSIFFSLYHCNYVLFHFQQPESLYLILFWQKRDYREISKIIAKKSRNRDYRENGSQFVSFKDFLTILFANFAKIGVLQIIKHDTWRISDIFFKNEKICNFFRKVGKMSKFQN